MWVATGNLSILFPNSVPFRAPHTIYHHPDSHRFSFSNYELTLQYQLQYVIQSNKISICSFSDDELINQCGETYVKIIVIPGPTRWWLERDECGRSPIALRWLQNSKAIHNQAKTKVTKWRKTDRLTKNWPTDWPIAKGQPGQFPSIAETTKN